MSKPKYSPDTVHRLSLAQMGYDAEVKSLSATDQQREGWKVTIAADAVLLEQELYQQALLSALNVASRFCEGGVNLLGVSDQRLRVRCPFQGVYLKDAIHQICERVHYEQPDDGPLILLGDTDKPHYHSNFAVCATWGGWRGGVCPPDEACSFESSSDKQNPLGCIYAAALAVGEVLQWYLTKGTYICSNCKGISLWQPENSNCWMQRVCDGPALALQSMCLHLIGLGHLGQAYLWTLAALPDIDRASVRLMLQDDDSVTEPNQSTSVLTLKDDVNKYKVDVCATRVGGLGFFVKTCTERFEKCSVLHEDAIVLGGVDNAETRLLLASFGCKLYIDCGLGLGHVSFRKIHMHAITDGMSSVDKIWRQNSDAGLTTLKQETIKSIIENGEMDECGAIAMADGRSVAASCVGLAASCIAISEAIRRSMDAAPIYEQVVCNLLERKVSAHPFVKS